MAAAQPFIKWINHASFIVSHADTRLVCDPWLEGTAFKDGWSQTSATVFDYAGFEDIDYIWLSHQHPDHFAPANLRKISSEARRRITVLYQTTPDRLVLNWCKSAGFGKVVELAPYEWTALNGGLSVMCASVSDDSWLAIRVGETTLLNVNDCVLKRREVIEPIARAVGRVDVLFTQFSYAQWAGNPGDVERRHTEALEKYQRIALQREIIQPKFIVPFASFIYFCHEENFYLNDCMNSVGDVARFIASELNATPIVLYPGDVWQIGDQKDWKRNAALYERDMRNRLAGGPTHFRNRRSLEDVERIAGAFIRKLNNKNPFARRLITGSTTVFLTDLDLAIRLSIEGFRLADVQAADADLVTSSENVLYAFKTPWGGNTLHVSGRFVSPNYRHERFFALMRKLHHYNVTPVNAEWLFSVARRLATGIIRRAMRARRHQPAAEV